MIGTIERIKNDVLMKCNNLNDKTINETLSNIIDSNIYHFTEELMNLYSGLNIYYTEEDLRKKVNDIIKVPIIKKIKRKLFIDSLALQITNDFYIEKFLNREISTEKIQKGYINELEKNKSTNQLNMTEDLDIQDIIDNLKSEIDKEIIPDIKENNMLVNATYNCIEKLKNEIELSLNKLISDCDNFYLTYLLEDLKQEGLEEKPFEKELNEGEDNMLDEMINVNQEDNIMEQNINKFDKYDDMTLFNKAILSLNTKEEKLSRKEREVNDKKDEIEKKLDAANKSIEMNIERENILTQRKLELNSKEVEVNSKLSEAEVIFLNIKPLLKGLNNIKTFDTEGGK